ncbi:MAG TPA: Rap1a/Tai family immunity protein, partial [Telluria sp.]
FPNRAIAAEYRDMVNGEFVHGYIQAVHDASEGREWCWTNSKPKPHTLIEDTRRHLQQLPHAELRSNAAALIVEHWRKRFPCSTKAERRPK